MSEEIGVRYVFGVPRNESGWAKGVRTLRQSRGVRWDVVRFCIERANGMHEAAYKGSEEFSCVRGYHLADVRSKSSVAGLAPISPEYIFESDADIVVVRVPCEHRYVPRGLLATLEKENRRTYYTTDTCRADYTCANCGAVGAHLTRKCPNLQREEVGKPRIKYGMPMGVRCDALRRVSRASDEELRDVRILYVDEAGVQWFDPGPSEQAWRSAMRGM